MTDTPPDRLSINPDNPYYDATLLERGVGVRFKGADKQNVDEYCVSEGWVRLAVGKAVDRKGNAMTVKLQGLVEPYFRDTAPVGELKMVEHTGGCACGAVRFSAKADPVGVRYCMCRGCQYLGAGSGTVGAAFPSAAVTIEGETGDFASTADSGNKMHRRFCAQCGTPLFSQAEARPGTIIIRVGAMDDPNAFTPTSIIWTKSAPVWACLDESLTLVEGQPSTPPVVNP